MTQEVTQHARGVLVVADREGLRRVDRADGQAARHSGAHARERLPPLPLMPTIQLPGLVVSLPAFTGRCTEVGQPRDASKRFAKSSLGHVLSRSSSTRRGPVQITLTAPRVVLDRGWGLFRRLEASRVLWASSPDMP